MANKEETILALLDSIYQQVKEGVPKVSKPVTVMAEEYLEKYPDKEVAIKRMQSNQIKKCTTSGFLSGLGGAITLPVAVSADIASVLYVQMRMIAATAYMSGLELDSDETQTFVYACLAGVSVDKVCADAGIKFANKLGVALIDRIPGEVLTKINQKVGFRFVTKFGEKGVVNLGKAVPVLGGVVGGGFNFAETKVIARRAYKLLYKRDVTDMEDSE